ncbi:glycosyltransferase family 4 protein [Vibrio crassostreae]|uniref:glycosyltransferase family 4 protein n=1 Tax=Vibrio crassostreae TaxID=246167 RepID=UPI001B313EB5
MKKSIAIIVSTPLTINSFMLGHIRELTKLYKVTVIANENLGILSDSIGVNFIHLPMKREISLVNDFVCTIKLINIIANGKFDAVHTITPKAALCGMVSSFICRSKHRFHTFTGQVWVTRTGLFRKLLILIDKFIFMLTSHALIDSPSQKKFLLSHDIVTDKGSTVLGQGSISGVDVSKFKYSETEKVKIRKKFLIPQDAFVYLFLGRLCKDKGIDELLEAFNLKNKSGTEAYLLLVGPNESDYDDVFFNGLNNDKIIVVGHTSSPNQYFSASDVLVLPSYREGFGTTVLEAAANGIPTIASDIYGLSDAVVDNETGLLHEVKNVYELSEHMSRLEEDRNLTKTLGEQAKERVNICFSSDYLTSELVNFYKEKVGV